MLTPFSLHHLIQLLTNNTSVEDAKKKYIIKALKSDKYFVYVSDKNLTKEYLRQFAKKN